MNEKLKELLQHIRTPPLQDKRWFTLLFVLLATFLLVAFKRDIPDGVLTLVGELTTAFLGVSMWGQNSRFGAATKAVTDAPAPAPAPQQAQ